MIRNQSQGLYSRFCMMRSSSLNLKFSLEENVGHDIGSVIDEVYLDTEGAARSPSTFTADVRGGVLNVTEISSGSLAIGQVIQYNDVLGTEPIITRFLTGSGGVGTYLLSRDDGICASENMCSCACIIVPTWAKYVAATMHIDFPAQVTGDGFASVHLFRNGKPTPPYGDNAYHCRQFYSSVNPSYTSITAVTGKIPVIVKNEAWSIRGYQSSLSAQTISGGANGGKQWLTCEFFSD